MRRDPKLATSRGAGHRLARALLGVIGALAPAACGLVIGLEDRPGKPGDAAVDGATADVGSASDAAPGIDGGSGIFVRGLTTEALANDYSLTLDIPPATVPGDLLLLTIVSDYDGANGGGLAPISGWKTLLSYGAWPCPGNGHRVLVASRVAAPNDAAQLHVAIAPSQRPRAGIVVAYAGVDPAAPIDNALSLEPTARPLVAPSLGTIRARTRIVRVLSSTPSVTFTWPEPLVQRASVGVAAVFDAPQDVAGPTGDATFDVSKLDACSFVTLTTIALSAL